MTRQLLIVFFFLLSLFEARGQAQAARDGTVEVTVTRRLEAAALEAFVVVDASAPISSSAAQVAGALAPVGIRLEHLRRIRIERPFSYSETPQPLVIQYAFEMAAPAARMESLTLEIARLAKAAPAPLIGIVYSAGLTPTPAALESARLAALPDAFAEARANAEATLTEAGQTPGPIVAIQDVVSSGYLGTAATLRLSLRMAKQSPGPYPARSVSTIVTREVTAAFDMAVVHISVGLDREKALQLLAPFGVTAAHLNSSQSALYAVRFGVEGESHATRAQTQFSYIIAAAATPRLVESLNKTSAETQKEIGLVFSVWIGHSSELLERERRKSIAGLLSEARLQAEPLAKLLALPLGAPRTINNLGSGTAPFAGYLTTDLYFASQERRLFPSYTGLAVEFAAE